MDDVRLGARYRALRHRLGWRQVDLADRADVTQDDVSRIERGRTANMPIRKLRQVAAALEAELPIWLRWRGGDLDRMMDEGHATLAGAVVGWLRRDGWSVQLEVSYAIYGERGSIDVLAWHETARTLLVVEVKTELVSLEETLRKHDEKVRLARVVSEPIGWKPTAIGKLLALPSLATPRRRVERHASVLQVAYPARGSAVRAWLREPAGALSGILFVQLASPGAVSRKRIRSRAA
jgi:transcriptional regulator with XRE-family HTH domain